VTDEQILHAILSREGSDYVNDPVDRGRCSRHGITRTTLQDWRGKLTTCADVEMLTEAEACDIYRARYIRPFDGVEESVRPQVVDIAVNAGVTRARTLLALAEQGPKPLNTQLVIERLKHYTRLVQADSSQTRFLGGWIARAVSFL
jgi:lysozyme family protein